MSYLITALVLIIYLVFTWLLASWMHLTGVSLSILRGGLALLGCVAAALFLWLRHQQPSESTAPDDEVNLLLKAAELKLKAANFTGGHSIDTLPVTLVIGLPGSAKTSVMTHSGLDAELLAGAVSADAAFAAAANVNVWFSGGTVFVEPSGNLLLDPPRWRALLARIRPARLRSTLYGGAQSPRTALLCFDAENLLANPEETAKQARVLRAKLTELAQTLGVQLPVYVLFTRIDKVPYFTEFVSVFSREEVNAVLGCTLPLDAVSPGLYADLQSARVGAAFDELFRSIAGARVDLLRGQNDHDKAGRAYEFPREFRKLRATASDFLVELCRPSQFSVGPALRGYYFTGVRPVIVEERVTPPAALVKAGFKAESKATMLFQTAAVAEPEPVPPHTIRSSRRTAQWVFLHALFRDILLSDKAAMGTSALSIHTTAMQRILLVTAVCLSIVLCTGFTVSFLNNRALQSAATAAIRELSASPTRADVPPIEKLQRLDALRASLETLSTYNSNGAPVRFRWGLYSGNALYPEVRQVYFDRFRAMLFADTQTKLVETLRSLPSKPGPDYGSVYDSLKAYLVTTSNHERSTPAFLEPVLIACWSKARVIDPARLALAARQFQFYAQQLNRENPYTSSNDAFAVATAREYLAQFGGFERVYRAILTEASKRYPAIDFNRQFPEAKAALLQSYQVAGAFTQPGWHFINDAIHDPSQYFTGEQWVLGNQQGSAVNVLQIRKQLRARYIDDFLDAWRAYLKGASLLRYTGIADATHKLDLLSGNRSPLLALFSLASQNTAVDDVSIAGQFQAVQAVVSPVSIDRFIAPSNQSYMSALLALQSSLEQAAQHPQTTDVDTAAILSAAGAAKIAARQVAQTFKPDPAGRMDVTVQKLLEEPITQVEGLVQAIGPEQLNGKARGFCAALAPLLAKYPFDRNAASEATVAEVDATFRKPDGAFWAFYNANLQKLVLRQGSRFAPDPAGPMHLTPAFTAFLNQMAEVSDTLYANGAQGPQFSYTLTPESIEGIQQLGLVLDGQTLSYSGGASPTKPFAWQGAAARQATASVRFGNGPELIWASEQGPWAIFHFFDKADQTQGSFAGMTSLEWTIRVGKDALTLPGGKPLTVRVNLGMETAPPLFNKSYLKRLSCNSLIAR